MSYDIIESAVFLALGILGLAGGLPQIIRWAKPNPHLQINKVTVERAPNDNYKHKIHLELENQTKGLARNGDATNITLDYFIINKTGTQTAITQNQTLSAYLVAGAKILTDIEAYHSLVPEGNPYSIIFMIKSRETATVKKRITYNADKIEYA